MNPFQICVVFFLLQVNQSKNYFSVKHDPGFHFSFYRIFGNLGFYEQENMRK